MKVRPPVVLLCAGLIACFMPGSHRLPVTPGEAAAAITPTPPEISAVITSNNSKDLVEVATIPVDTTRRIIWQPDSRSAAVMTNSGLSIYDLTTNKPIYKFKLPENTTLLDYDPGSQMLAITSDHQSLEIRPLKVGVSRKIPLPGGFGSAAFEKGGERIWVSSQEEFKVAAFDTTTGLEVDVCKGFDTAAPVYSVSTSPQGKYLVWIARATIQLNHLPGCSLAASMGHQDFITAYAFSSSDELLAVSAGGELDGKFQPLLYMYTASNGSPQTIISLIESPAVDVDFSPDSSVIAAAGSGLTVFDVKTGHELKSLAAADHRFTADAFSPDGRLFAAADEVSLHIYAISR